MALVPRPRVRGVHVDEAAGPGHPHHLRHRRLDRLHVLDGREAVDDVEDRLRERQPLGRGAHEGAARLLPLERADRDGLRVGVDPDRPHPRLLGRHVEAAGPAAHVEEPAAQRAAEHATEPLEPPALLLLLVLTEPHQDGPVGDAQHVAVVGGVVAPEPVPQQDRVTHRSC